MDTENGGAARAANHNRRYINNGPLQGVKTSFVTVPRERILTEAVFGESAFYPFKRAIVYKTHKRYTNSSKDVYSIGL